MRVSKATLLMLVIGQFGCGARGTDAPAPLTEEAARERLLQIAKEYESYGRVDRVLRWSPLRCRAPFPARLRFSESEDSETHGRKLYSVFAKHSWPARWANERSSYLTMPDGKVPVGQAIVKEAWEPKEVSEVNPRPPGFTKRDFVYPYVHKADRIYRADHKAGLFIMYKLDPATAGTDEGWVYGTVTPDGKTVTSAGRVESCMKCHESAPHDRLFGLPEEQSDPNE